MIRRICEEDATMFLELMNKIDTESDFLLFEPGERMLTVESVCTKIKYFSETDSLFLVAEDKGKLMGYITAERGMSRRIRHKVILAIGIVQTYTGKGLGTGFFKEVEKWAARSGVMRLELDVMAHNERALGVYKKLGFKVEGIREKAVKIEGKFIDDYFMAKIINS